MIIEKIPDIQKLTAHEKAILVRELWADLGDQGHVITEDPDLPKVLDERWNQFLRDPNGAIPWTEVKRRIEEKFGS